MNCDAAVYTPVAITVPATKRKSAQISSLSLLEVASTRSLISLTVCFLLLLIRVGPVLFSVSFLVLCSVFSFSMFSFSQFRSGICFTGIQCCAYLSFLLSLVPHTFLQLWCQSLLLSNPSCVLLLHDRVGLLRLLGFSLPFSLHSSLGT